MLGFVSRLVGGAVSPLLDQVTTFGAGLLRKLALFLVAAICMAVVAIALTLAFAFWISSLSNPIVGALAVAALYLAIAIGAVGLALRKRPGTRETAEPEAAQETAADNDRVDQFTAPLLSILASLGLRREQLAVLAGATLAKRLRPISLVGVAIVAGFLVGRLWQGWEALFPNELVGAVADLINPNARKAARDDGAGRNADGD